MTLRPMLAAKLEDVGPLQFPYLASPKLDGVRALVINGVVMSRSLKPIPNKYVQKLFGRPALEGFDGELCVGPANAKDLMQKTMSGVMSSDGEPDVCYHVFDVHTCDGMMTFEERYSWLWNQALCWPPPVAGPILLVPQTNIKSQDEMDVYEAKCLELGYEGIMLRTLDGGYKQGRCGKKQPYLIKVKRFEDSEAEVIGLEELMHNDNPAETNELGRTKRSTHQENKRPAGVLGALICKTKEGVVFNIGTGFTAEQRAEMWRTGGPGAGAVGRIAKYKHFANAGVKDAPRFPVFLGFRHPSDT